MCRYPNMFDMFNYVCMCVCVCMCVSVCVYVCILDHSKKTQKLNFNLRYSPKYSLGVQNHLFEKKIFLKMIGSVPHVTLILAQKNVM